MDWGVLFFFAIQNPLKNGLVQRFWRVKITSSNQIHVIIILSKLKILIINIHLSFSTKPLSKKRWKISLFSSLLPSFQSLPLTFPPNSQLDPKNYFHNEKLQHNI